MNEELNIKKRDDWSQYTVSELKKKIKEIEKAIERKEEVKKVEVKDHIMRMLKDSGLTLSDVGLSTIGKRMTKKRVLAVKYRHPDTGETWTGVGRTPAWLVAAQHETGKTLEDFAV